MLRLERAVHRNNLFALAGLLAAGICAAGDLVVNVVDPAGRAVAEVVVTVSPMPATAIPPAPAPAVMDQRQLAFAPQVLVVGLGARVDFPNSDSVSHQVYSFSPPKKFQLPLYKGQPHTPVTFDQPGLVVLGCNIHDHMVGYIYVTDASFFGKTDSAGAWRQSALAAGDYRLTVWSPFIDDPAAKLTRTLRVEAKDSTVTLVQLARALRARPEPRPRRGDWEY